MLDFTCTQKMAPKEQVNKLFILLTTTVSRSMDKRAEIALLSIHLSPSTTDYY